MTCELCELRGLWNALALMLLFRLGAQLGWLLDNKLLLFDRLDLTSDDCVAKSESVLVLACVLLLLFMKLLDFAFAFNMLLLFMLVTWVPNPWSITLPLDFGPLLLLLEWFSDTVANGSWAKLFALALFRALCGVLEAVKRDGDFGEGLCVREMGLIVSETELGTNGDSLASKLSFVFASNDCVTGISGMFSAELLSGKSNGLLTGTTGTGAGGGVTGGFGATETAASGTAGLTAWDWLWSSR